MSKIQCHSKWMSKMHKCQITNVKKALMSNIGVLIGVGAPTSLAIDLANKFDMTLVGFVKQDSFNIYSNINRVVIKS